jgi:ankyrin repeat protein
MIEKGANDYEGGLMIACVYGHVDIANFMISKGAKSYLNCYPYFFPVLLRLQNVSGHVPIFKELFKIDLKQFRETVVESTKLSLDLVLHIITNYL